MRTLEQQMGELRELVGRGICCVCEEPPTAEAPLYRLNRPPAGPLWACWRHYVRVKLREPVASTPRLDE